MTRVTRPVRRETSAVVFSRGNRAVIVEIEPPGRMIGFRLKGTRTTHWLPVDFLYRTAVQATVEAKRRAKRDAKKAKGRSL